MYNTHHTWLNLDGNIQFIYIILVSQLVRLHTIHHSFKSPMNLWSTTQCCAFVFFFILKTKKTPKSLMHIVFGSFFTLFQEFQKYFIRPSKAIRKRPQPAEAAIAYRTRKVLAANFQNVSFSYWTFFSQRLMSD